MSAVEKKSALLAIANGASVPSLRKAKYRIGGSVVHVRFSSQSAHVPAKYKFNICQVPDNCINIRRLAFFIGRDVIRSLIEELRSKKPC